MMKGEYPTFLLMNAIQKVDVIAKGLWSGANIFSRCWNSEESAWGPAYFLRGCCEITTQDVFHHRFDSALFRNGNQLLRLDKERWMYPRFGTSPENIEAVRVQMLNNRSDLCTNTCLPSAFLWGEFSITKTYFSIRTRRRLCRNCQNVDYDSRRNAWEILDVVPQDAIVIFF